MSVGRESVTYRLAVAGDEDVTRRFAKIAESGEGSAKRLGRAYERDLRVAEASVERLQRRAETLNALGGSAIQQRIAGATGLDRSLAGSGDAERSMAAFVRQQDELAQARSRLLAQADPLFAAQQRYNQAMTEATRLDRQGALAKGDLTRITAAARAQLDQTRASQQALTASSGAMRAGYQQVGFQISDFAVQVGAGTSAVRAAALQGPQLVQALALMGSGAQSSTGRFAAMTSFLAGPWGAAITVGTSLLGALAVGLTNTDKASDAAVRGLKKVRTETERASEAYERLIRLQQRSIETDLIENDIALNKLRNTISKAIEARREAEERGVNQRVLDLMDRNQMARRLEELNLINAQNIGRRILGEQKDKEAEAEAKQGLAESARGRAAGLRTSRQAIQLERDRQRFLEQNIDSVRALSEASSPLLAIANTLKDELAEINRLASVSAAEGGIGSERADILRNQARARARVARGDLFTDAFQTESDANRRDDEALETRRQYIADLIADQETGNRLLDLEFTLLGATNAERERALSTFELKEELMRNGIDLASEEARQALAGNDAQQRNLEILRQQNEVLDEQARIGGQLIDTIFDPQQWDDWGALGKRVLQDLIREMAVLALVNPLKNAAFGSQLPVLGDLGGFFGLAGGSEYTRAGLYEVGEFGKELVRLPRGAQVINANRTRQIERAAPSGSGRPSLNVVINAEGADPAALARVVDAVQELDRNIEDRAITATMDLNDRTFGRAYARPI